MRYGCLTDGERWCYDCSQSLLSRVRRSEKFRSIIGGKILPLINYEFCKKILSFNILFLPKKLLQKLEKGLSLYKLFHNFVHFKSIELELRLPKINEQKLLYRKQNQFLLKIKVWMRLAPRVNNCNVLLIVLDSLFIIDWA